MLPGVLGYPPGGLADGLRIDVPRLVAPALIGMLVHVTMIASKITTTGHLQDVLTYRNRHPVSLILWN
jgi:hypothetical protein